ncbi:DUF4465 domain-containing protein [Planctomycetota bacterium]
MLKKVMSLVLLLSVASAAGAGVIDFEDLSLSSESHWNGSDSSGGFASGWAWFDNYYNTTYGSWDGFAYSNITDSAATGWGAQYNSITGSGESSSANYGVGFDPVPAGFGVERPTMALNTVAVVDEIYVTNNSYAYYSMLNGDSFAKKFGGQSGDDADWFLLTITGKDIADVVTGTVEFYLADYRFADNSLDYIIDTWESVDLTSLGAVKSIEFSLNSSDVGTSGMNTPAYFVVDSIVPEPITIAFLGFGTLFVRRFRRQ